MLRHRPGAGVRGQRPVHHLPGGAHLRRHRGERQRQERHGHVPAASAAQYGPGDGEVLLRRRRALLHAPAAAAQAAGGGHRPHPPEPRRLPGPGDEAPPPAHRGHHHPRALEAEGGGGPGRRAAPPLRLRGAGAHPEPVFLPDERRHEPAAGVRPGAGLPAGVGDRRRAHQGPGCSDPQPGVLRPAPDLHRAPLQHARHHPRSGPGPPAVRRHPGTLHGPDHRAGHGGGGHGAAPPPLYRRPDPLPAQPGHGAHTAPGPRTAGAHRLPLLPPLPQGHGALRPGGAGGGHAAHGREGEVLPL